MKTLIKTTLFIFILAVMMSGGSAEASEITGTISSGGGGSGATVVVPPTASPTGAAYTSTQSVTLSTTNATIYYTTDGSKPECLTSTLYSSPIDVSVSQLIRALSCYANDTASSIAEFAYAISIPATGSGGGGGGGGGSSVVTTPETEGNDFNNDGSIDVLDFNVLMVNWGSTEATSSTGDANGDGNVDIFDFNLLIINWQS